MFTPENVNFVADFVRHALGLTVDYSNEEIINVIMRELNVEEFDKMPEEYKEAFPSVDPFLKN